MKRMCGLLLTALSFGIFTGCMGEDPVVSTSTPVTVNLNVSPSSPTVGQEFTLSASTEAKDPSYEWKEGGSATDEDGWSSGEFQKKVTKSSAGSFVYHVRVTSGKNKGTATKMITVLNSSGSVTLNANKTSYSLNETITLTASTASPNPSYEWKDGASGTWTSGSATKTYTKGSAGSYTFYVKMTSSGSSAEKSVTVTVTSGSVEPGNYPVHTGITASTFWVGEHGSDDNFNISNVGSSWDVKWGDNFGIEDKPLLDRDANFIPTSSAYKKKENPFYFALPYNDFDAVAYDGSDCDAFISKAGRSDLTKLYDADYGRDIVTTSSVKKVLYDTKKNSIDKIYWKNEQNSWSGKSIVKARWIKITWNGKSCYAQWADAGPYYYDDYDYVFGTAQPMNQQVKKDSPNAGIDLSPSVMLYLGVRMWEQGAEASNVSWQFVDAVDVPDGPWKKYVSTNAVVWQ